MLDKLLLNRFHFILVTIFGLQHNHVELFADGDHITRMIDATPAHIGDVQQTVETVEVDERAEVGAVGQLGARAQLRPQRTQQLHRVQGGLAVQPVVGRGEQIRLLAAEHGLDYETVLPAGFGGE